MINLDRQTILHLCELGIDTRYELLLLHNHGPLILGDDIVVLVVILPELFLVYHIL